MKKTIILLFLFVFANHLFAQKIRFEYDEAGNQIVRTWCSSCLSKNSEKVKDISEINESDLLKFFEKDVISYYPNPVENELYIKWELIDNNLVNNIEVFSLNGQLIKTLKDLNEKDSELISFQEFPKGTYFLQLNYTDGGQKSIKIIKK
jgi:hypothetical protein